MTSGRLVFGTSGLRAPVGPTVADMNQANVLRATRAALEVFGGAAEVRSMSHVVIGFDARTHSRAFAEASASLALRMGYGVRLFDAPVATPVVVHAGTVSRAAATFVFTASHNPRDDHGLKVYDAAGRPIVEPVDASIAARMHDAREPPEDLPLSALPPPIRSHLRFVGDAELRSHVDACRSAARAYFEPGDTPLRIAYTALHGVGQRSVDLLFDDPRFAVESVATQAAPDGTFPTAPNPNPELPEALEALRELLSTGAFDLGLANDPDADRLAVVLPTPNGMFTALHGDEIGALLGERAMRACPAAAKAFVLSTMVSASWLERIASDLGVAHERTLTGHKWLQARRAAREAAGERFAFAYEEALGYAFPTAVYDKDGLAAALCFGELARGHVECGRSIWDALETIARRHGMVRSASRTYAADAATLARLEAMRRAPPTTLCKRAIVSVYDGRAQASGTPTGPTALPRSSLLAFSLEDGRRVALRPSGTEPKVKVYLEATSSLRDGEGYLEARARLDGVLDDLADGVRRWFLDD